MHKWKMKVLSAMLAVSMIVSLTGTPAYAAGVPALEEEGMESISGESVSDGEENVDEEMQSGNAEISHQNQTEETAAASDGNSVGNELQEPLSSDNEVQEAESVSRTEVEPYQDSESKDKVWTTNSDYVEYIQLGGMSNNQCTDNGAEAYWNQDKQRYEVILLDSQQISTRTFILGDRDNSKDGVQWCLFKENGRRYASNLSTRVNSEKAVNHLLGQLQLSKIIAGKEFVGDDVNLLIVQNVKNTLNGVPEEDILENKIKMHFSLRTSLAKADGLKVVKADGTAESVEKYQSYIFGYNVGVEDDQETVTLECKPETPLSTENTVGTVLEYFDKDGNKITPTAEKLTSDNKGKQVTFSLKDLEVNEEGDPYVQIRVSYNGGGEVKASTYTVQFKLPERQWQVEADSDQEVTCNKGDTPRLAVKLSGSPTGRVQYQWYDTLKDYRGAMIPGANEVTYVPSTVYSGTAQYYCKVTETLESGVQVSMYSPIFTVKVRATYASEPQITQQPEDMEVFIGKEAYLSVRAKNVDDGTQTQLSIQWYLVGENGAEDIPVGKEYMGLFSRQLVNTSKSGSYKYYALVTNTVKDALDIEPATIKSNVVTVTVKAIPGTEDLEGTGDEEDPYLVKNIEDLKKLKKIVEGGNTLEGRYIKLAADLTLPADWDPIGCYQEGHDENVPGSDFNGKYINPFSGNFDGGGHKVTIEDGGQAIFKYVWKASIRNMEIYGRDIKGSAVVSGMFTDYGTTGLYDMYESPWTVKIENVTLLTGSKTSDSGFLPGSGSGVNSVWITNCEIQEGVTVGNPEEASPYVGGFIGFMNGYITNSVCRATVYGGGGLAAMKGQTMGACRINNSAFIGTLVSAGRAGGIIGSGYGYRSEYHKWDLSAPNTPVVTIQNCYVRADITGSIMVGGIIGGEPSCVECWGNGEGKIANCSFQGTLTATSPQTDVGGIVGFLNGFDKYQGIENCYYNNNCGAEKGIGYIEQIILKEDNERYGLDEVPDFSKLCIATKPENFLNGKVVEALNAPNNSFKNWVQGKRRS